MTTMAQPMPAAPQAGRVAMPPKFGNGLQWIESLGDVPLARVIFDPWPGTATEQDLLHFVERDKRLCELIDGTLVEKTVGFDEGQVATVLATALANYVMPRRLGAVAGGDATLRMASGRIRLPDVSFVAKADVPSDYRRGTPVPRLPPTLAVEVLSEGNTAAEMRQKCREYFESGSKLVWLVDPPTRTVAIYTGPTAEPDRTLTDVDALDGGDALPGFTFPVADLFRDPFEP
jgi:Uma2 family endonuclease